MKKSQISQVFTYIAAILVIGLLVIFGYKAINMMLGKQCDAQRAIFEKNMLSLIDEYSDYGSVHEETIRVPCDTNEVCFADASYFAGYCSGSFSGSGIGDYTSDSVITSAVEDCSANMFLKGGFTEPFNSADKFSDKIILDGDPFQCFPVKNQKVTLVFTGTGSRTIISNDTVSEPQSNPANPPANPNACTSDCTPSGSTQCSSTSNYQTCGNYDADTCLEWSSDIACPSGTSCSNGACQQTLPNQCTASDWSYTDGACQPGNTLTRNWIKTGTCQGGVTHSPTETIACTYSSSACNDGVDNDGDGYIDMDDMGCTSPASDNENPAITTCRTDFYSINGNIILNPNMECDNNHDGSPDNWIVTGSGPINTKWRSSVLGRNSRVMVGSRQSGTVLSSWRQSIPVSKLKPNSWYEVTFDMAAENSIAQFSGNHMKDDSYWAGLGFYASDSTGTKTAMSQLYGIYGPAFSDWDEAAGVYRSATTRALEPWRKVVSYVKTPAAFTNPEVYNMLYTDTSFYVDNVVIREVSSDLQAQKLTSGTLSFIKYKGADFFPIILEGAVYRNYRGNSISKDEIYNIGFNTLYRDQWTNKDFTDLRFAQMDVFSTLYYSNNGGELWVNDPSHQVTYTGWDIFKSYFNPTAPNLLFVRLFDEITYPTNKGMNIGYTKPLEKTYNYIKQQNPNVLVFTNYNGYYADGPYTRNFEDLAKYYFPYVDATSFTQNLPRYYVKGDELPETYGLGAATRKYASFTDPSGKKKYYIAFGLGVPEWSNWNVTGTCPSSNEFKCNEYVPFNLQRYQVWEQIINGAVGVTFWGLNNYCYLYTLAPDYEDPKYCDYQFNQSAKIVRELHSLYDVLLEPQYYADWTVSNDAIDVMMKKHNEKIYLFTASTAFVDLHGITFTLPGYTITGIRALNEVDNGQISSVYTRIVSINPDRHSFKDDFIGETSSAIQGKAAPGYAVHIYEITADPIS